MKNNILGFKINDERVLLLSPVNYGYISQRLAMQIYKDFNILIDANCSLDIFSRKKAREYGIYYEQMQNLNILTEHFMLFNYQATQHRGHEKIIKHYQIKVEKTLLADRMELEQLFNDHKYSEEVFSPMVVVSVN